MRYRAVLGKLVARTALHVGSGRAAEMTDALVRRDAQGRVLIPGTALAGALRTLGTRLVPRLATGGKKGMCLALESEVGGATQTEVCGCLVCDLFGELNPREGDAGAGGGRAARLWVYDARPEAGIWGGSVRDMVGIDRSTGAAASGAAAKFDLELVPAGSVFQLRLELDSDSTTAHEEVLGAALAEWQAGRCVLGGRVARGLGAFDLEDLRLATVPLDKPGGLMAFLRSDEPWGCSSAVIDKDWLAPLVKNGRGRVRAETALSAAVARGYAAITFKLKAEGLFLTHDAESAVFSGFDHAPLLDHPDREGRPVLAGAGLRGVLRSQAERIARTLATLRCNDLAAFTACCPACDPMRNPIRNPALDQPTPPLASCDAMLRIKRKRQELIDHGDALAGELCLACRLFGSPRRGSRLRVEDSKLVDGEPVTYKPVDFLAIDRFTGGGKDGAKFDALGLWRPSFNVRMHLENPEPWELGWLVLVLRDMHAGLVRLGFGAAKGFGEMRLSELKIRLGFLDAADLRHLVDNVDVAQAPTSGFYREHVVSIPDLSGAGAWQQVAEHWVKAFTEMRFDRNEAGTKLDEDSYFGRRAPDGMLLSELYPKEVALHAE